MAESKTTRKQTKSYVTWLFEIWRSGDLHTLSSRFRLDGSLLDYPYHNLSFQPRSRCA